VNDDLHPIQWHNWHAKVLGRDDLFALSGTDKLFARKVDGSRDQTFLDEVNDLATVRASSGAVERICHKHGLV
jgi:hypothetical protein